MWHCFSRQSSADGNVVTSFNQKTNKENLIKLRNKQRQPYQIEEKKQRQYHSIRKQTKTTSSNKEKQTKTTSLSKNKKQRQPH